MSEDMTTAISNNVQSSLNHSCGHSYHGSSPKCHILKLINESQIELSPKEVSTRTGINHSTARKYLRILLGEGEVLQPYHGAYCSKSVHGVRFAPLRVHNVVLSCPALWLDFSQSSEEVCGAVKIRVVYGLDRKRITGFISCDNGMDKDTALFAINRFIEVVESRTKRAVENFVVKTFEVNRDYCGIRLDGVQCVTRKGLFACIERIYQKEPNLVRHEFKVSEPMSLDQFSALIQGVSQLTTFNRAFS